MENINIDRYTPLESIRIVKNTRHCRFCACPWPKKQLIDFSVDETILSMLYTLKLSFLNLEDPELPRLICHLCEESFQRTFGFIKRLKEAQDVLKSMYRNFDIKYEDGSDEEVKIEVKMSSDEERQEINEPKIKSPNRMVTRRQTNILLRNKTVPIAAKVKKRHTMVIEGSSRESSSDSSVISNNSVPVDKNKIKKKSKSTKIKVKKNSTVSVISEDTDSEISESSGKSKISVDENLDDLPTYCSLPVFEDNMIDIGNQANESWDSYPWFCKHCNVECDSMADLREHSKQLHEMCYGFECEDCTDQFNMFNAFIEHVRRHREELRYYCEYCNQHSESISESMSHTRSHWSGGGFICERCGELCQGAEALATHRRMYKQVTLPRREHQKRPKQVTPAFTYGGIPVFEQVKACTGVSGWDTYVWACQECYHSCPDAKSLRAHTREVHNKCFAMKCADCLKVARSYVMFVPHVQGHRPWLKHYCQYCNQHFEQLSELSSHVDSHLEGPRRPCDGCGEVFDDGQDLLEHFRVYDPVRRKGTLTTADLTCDQCKRVFKTMFRLRTHQKTHTQRKREHICDLCGKGFYTHHLLAGHALTHVKDKKEECRLCKKLFPTKYRLRNHVRTHMEAKGFTCDVCGKRTKNCLQCHIMGHMDVRKYKCSVCEKAFKFKNNLNTHMNMHTGQRPYFCSHCDRTFANWSNCNKHMVRKHGVTLAKTKLTAQGRMDLNEETGKPKKIVTDKRTKEWISEVMKPGKRGKKTKGSDKT